MRGGTFAAAPGSTRTTRRQSSGAPGRALPMDGHVAMFLKDVKKWKYTSSWDMSNKDGCVVSAVQVRAHGEIGVRWRGRGQRRRRKSMRTGKRTGFWRVLSVLSCLVLSLQVAGVFTNLFGGVAGSRYGLRCTLLASLVLQVRESRVTARVRAGRLVGAPGRGQRAGLARGLLCSRLPNNEHLPPVIWPLITHPLCFPSKGGRLCRLLFFILERARPTAGA